MLPTPTPLICAATGGRFSGAPSSWWSCLGCTLLLLLLIGKGSIYIVNQLFTYLIMALELLLSMIVKQLVKSYRSRLWRPGKISGIRGSVLKRFQIRRKIESVEKLFDNVILYFVFQVASSFFTISLWFQIIQRHLSVIVCATHGLQ